MMQKLIQFLATICALILLPVAAVAVPINVEGSYQFDGNGDVGTFTITFDTTIDVTETTEFAALPLTSGSVKIGEKTFERSIFLRFATNAFGGFGALVLSQGSSPFSGTELPNFFQISASFSPSTSISTLLSERVSAPLLGFDYILPSNQRPFVFGQNAGLGLITFTPAPAPAPVPLPVSATALLLGLACLAGQRKFAKRR